MNKIVTISLVLVLVFLSFFSLFKAYNQHRLGQLMVLPTPSPVENPNAPLISIPSPISTETQTQTVSYAYLFQEGREPDTSNIVGYFAHGAFAWYVPDWVVTNWTVKNDVEGDGFAISPKVRPDPEAFSDIIFKVLPSTEYFNAENLYNEEQNVADPGSILIHEVVLNKHGDGGLKVIMETETRIYHIQKRLASGRMREIYILDGNGKTLGITFDARADIFDQFSLKIRNLVEGIGELRAPQG